MCTGLEWLAVASTTASVAQGVNGLIQQRDARKKGPLARQETKAPKVGGADDRRRGAGPAYGMQTPSLLSSSSTKSNSLLGS